MYFFTYETDLPENVGFAHFGGEHLIWLAGIVLFWALASWWFWGQSGADHVRLSRRLAWCCLAVEALSFFVLFLIGHLSVTNLPLHLCQIAPVLYLIFSCTGWDWAGQTCYALCLPGALAALLFPDWNMYPQWNFMNLTSFVFHALLVLFPLWQLLSGAIRPRLGALWKVCLFLALIVPAIYWFDVSFQVNYFFLIADAPDSPLSVLYTWFGQRGYLPAFGALTLAVMFLMILPWEHARKRRRQ